LIKVLKKGEECCYQTEDSEKKNFFALFLEILRIIEHFEKLYLKKKKLFDFPAKKILNQKSSDNEFFLKSLFDCFSSDNPVLIMKIKLP